MVMTGVLLMSSPVPNLHTWLCMHKSNISLRSRWCTRWYILAYFRDCSSKSQASQADLRSSRSKISFLDIWYKVDTHTISKPAMAEKLPQLIELHTYLLSRHWFQSCGRKTSWLVSGISLWWTHLKLPLLWLHSKLLLWYEIPLYWLLTQFTTTILISQGNGVLLDECLRASMHVWNGACWWHHCICYGTPWSDAVEYRAECL